MPTNSTKLAQAALGLYCKNGKNEPATSIQENTFHYRRLVLNIGLDTIKNAYPIALELIGEEKFNHAIEVFYEKHSCKTPQVWQLPFEFYEYYLENDFPFEHNFPFLQELLLFEWLEIEVFMMPDEEIKDFQAIKDIQTDEFVGNPEVIIQVLQYPIHKKNGKEITIKDKGIYYISIHRDIESKKVFFNEISYPLALFLQDLQNKQTITINQLVNYSEEFFSTKEEANTYAEELIAFSIENGLILGAKK